MPRAPAGSSASRNFWPAAEISDLAVQPATVMRPTMAVTILSDFMATFVAVSTETDAAASFFRRHSRHQILMTATYAAHVNAASASSYNHAAILPCLSM